MDDNNTNTASEYDVAGDVFLAPWLDFVERFAPAIDDEDLGEALRTKSAVTPLTDEQVGALLTRAAAVRVATAASEPTQEEELAAREAAEARWAEHEKRMAVHRSSAAYGLEGVPAEVRAAVLGAEWRRRYRTRPPARLRAMIRSTAPKRQRANRRRSTSAGATSARGANDARPRRLERRRCPCGCGYFDPRRPNQLYRTPGCRVRAFRQRDDGLGLRTVRCTACGERLCRSTPDGLCGFCRQGVPAEAKAAA
jgi:hypothetical protein